MRRIIFLFVSLLISMSAMAYSFVGKTFSGTADNENGKATVSIVFKAGDKGTVTTVVNGKRMSDAILWEVSGDYINLYDRYGNLCYFLQIDYDGENPVLGLQDNNGYVVMWLSQSKAAAPAAGKTKKKKR